MAPDTDTVETTEKDAPEFFSDDHRKAHVAALVREKEGYEAKAAGLKERGDADQSKYYDGRAGEVDAQLKRLSSKAQTGRQRAETR